MITSTNPLNRNSQFSNSLPQPAPMPIQQPEMEEESMEAELEVPAFIRRKLK